MRRNIRENVLLIHITSSFIKANIHEYTMMGVMTQILQLQVHKFYVVTSPPASPVAWSVHLRKKSSAIKLLRVVFHKTNQSTTLQENHQLPVPNLSLNNWVLHILSLLLSCVERNETIGGLQDYQSWDCWDQNLPAPPWSPCTSEELHLQLKNGE